MQLLFFLTGDFSDEDVKALRGVVSELRSSHRWFKSAPEFIDEVDESEPEELRTVGGVVQLPEVGPIETERRGFADLIHLVGALRGYSGARGRELEFELDGTFVGDIQDGNISRTLQAGLIDPWRERVQTS